MTRQQRYMSLGVLAIVVCGAIFAATLSRQEKLLTSQEIWGVAPQWPREGALFLRGYREDELFVTVFDQVDLHEYLKGRDPTPNHQVLRYTPSSHWPFRATANDWQSTTSRKVWYGQQGASLIEPLRFDPNKYQLYKDGAEVSALARTVAAVCGAPDERQVAVLSTTTEAPPSGMFFAGGLWSDTYYHQVFDRQTGGPVGEAIALRHSEKWTPGAICWSADSRFVAYTSFEYEGLWVVPVPPLPSEEK